MFYDEHNILIWQHMYIIDVLILFGAVFQKPTIGLQFIP